MKKLFILLAPLALVACGDRVSDVQSNGSTAASTNTTSVVDTVVLSAARGFAAAEKLYTITADGLIIPVKAGVFDVPTLKKIKALNQRATEILKKGHSAIGIAEKAALATELFGIEAQLSNIRGDR